MLMPPSQQPIDGEGAETGRCHATSRECEECFRFQSGGGGREPVYFIDKKIISITEKLNKLPI